MHSLASSGISSAHASEGPQLVSAGEQAHDPLLAPTFPFPLPPDLQLWCETRALLHPRCPSRKATDGLAVGQVDEGPISGGWGLPTCLCPRLVI